jgi:hypothetical protein
MPMLLVCYTDSRPDKSGATIHGSYPVILSMNPSLQTRAKGQQMSLLCKLHSCSPQSDMHLARLITQD